MGQIPSVKLVDSTFAPNNSVSLAGENIYEKPKTMEWDRTPGDADIKVFTDLRLREAVDDPAKKKIAWLVESPAYSKQAYEDIRELEDVFDHILTFSSDIWKPNPHGKYLFYALGGSWINERKVFYKNELVSMIVGKKQDTVGQQLRHEIAEMYKKEVVLFGEPYTDYIPTKASALRNFCFSIVVENEYHRSYFTEKLIDCMSQGTIPIYWGCPDSFTFFDDKGIVGFRTADQIGEILDKISFDTYRGLEHYAKGNFTRSENFRIAEDWIMEHHPSLFTEL